MAYLPSKKIIFLAILISLIFGGWFWYSKKTAEKQNTGNVKKNNPREERILTGFANSDNSGLKDWEKALAVNGQNKESLPEKESPAASETAPEATSTDLTEDMSQMLLQSYLNFKQSGLPLAADEKSAISDSFVSAIQSALPKNDDFSLSNIQIDPDSSDQKIKFYLNRVAEIIYRDDASFSESQLDILNRALETENPKELAKLNERVNVYEITIDNLLKTPVPKSMSQFHLELLNISRNAQKSAVLMASSLDNPASGIAGIRLYLEQSQRTKNLFDTLSQILVRKNIAFSSQEKGVIFYYYLAKINAPSS